VFSECFRLSSIRIPSSLGSLLAGYQRLLKIDDPPCAEPALRQFEKLRAMRDSENRTLQWTSDTKPDGSTTIIMVLSPLVTRQSDCIHHRLGAVIGLTYRHVTHAHNSSNDG
jgi:hypothetical protein